MRRPARAASLVTSAATGLAAAPGRHFSAAPKKFDGVPRRDARFPDPYNMGVHAEAFLYDEQMPPELAPQIARCSGSCEMLYRFSTSGKISSSKNRA